ncbi:unnamed protein product [Pedinophyceae sp. YPF-701]|nr:unnamed protein product [Pedinophyceae sp. YPF-701]
MRRGAFTGGKCDAVIILAGGQLRDGTLPEWVTRRVDRAAELWRERGSVVICSGGGTPHKPPILNPQGFVVHEAVSCAQYLMERGVPASAILREVSSYDTIGNAYFSIVIHALPRGFRRLCVVTSEFHMPRSRAIFEELCRMAAPAAAPGGTAGPGGVFELEYVSVSDDGVFDDEVLRAREEREAKSLRTWREGGGAIGSLGEFSQWLHETHLCYAVSRQHELGRPTAVDDKALASY